MYNIHFGSGGNSKARLSVRITPKSVCAVNTNELHSLSTHIQFAKINKHNRQKHSINT